MVGVLRCWNSRWRQAVFSPDENRLKLKYFKKLGAFCGYCYRHNGVWYALYRHRDDLYFYADGEKYKLGGDTECEFLSIDGKRKTRFSLRSTDGRTMHVDYLRSSNLLDPTFDLMDIEMNDFFFWVYSVCGDEKWRNGLLQRYASA